MIIEKQWILDVAHSAELQPLVIPPVQGPTAEMAGMSIVCLTFSAPGAFPSQGRYFFEAYRRNGMVAAVLWESLNKCFGRRRLV